MAKGTALARSAMLLALGVLPSACRSRSEAPPIASAAPGRAAPSGHYDETDVHALKSTEGGPWPSSVRGVVWSEQGDSLLSLDGYGVTLIQTEGFRVVRRLDSSGSKLGAYGSPAISAEAGKIALCRLSGIDLWTIDLAQPLAHIGSAFTTALAFADGGRELLANFESAEGEELQRLQVGSGQVLQRFPRDRRVVGTTTVDARGRFVATANGFVSLWKGPEFALAWTHDLEPRALSVQFGREGDVLFTAQQSGKVVEWDVATGAQRFTACCFELAAAARPWLVLATAEKFQVLSLSDHRVVREERRADRETPFGLELAPNGLLAEVTLDGRLRIWKIDGDGRLSLAAPRTNTPSTRTKP